jgi:hypothetical protein
MSKPLRLLGLDIDGVLNDHTINYPLYDSHFRLVGTIPGDRVCKYKANMLRLLLQRARTNGTPVTVVGISSWFAHKKFDRVAASLYEKTGIKIDIMSPGTGGGTYRCTAMLDIVCDLKPAYWCVLDDSAFYDNQINHRFYADKPYYDIGQHIIRPHGRYGIGGYEHERCIELLGLTTESYSGLPSKASVQHKFEQYMENKPWIKLS